LLWRRNSQAIRAFSHISFVSASFRLSLSVKKSRAVAQTCPFNRAKTRGLGMVETADGVFGLRYRGKSYRHVYCHLVIHLFERMVMKEVNQMEKMKALVFHAAGLGDNRIVTTLCPGGKERMRRLMKVVRGGRVDLTPLLTHTFSLDNIKEGYRVFSERLDGALKVAIKP
jgi:hypothetical protein